MTRSLSYNSKTPSPNPSPENGGGGYGSTPKRFLFLCRREDRRGSLYLSVLGVAMIITAIGMSAITVARVNLRSTTWRQDRREARMLADAALELGAGTVIQNPIWRTDFDEGEEYPPTPFTLGNGTIAWKLVDSDNDLNDDDTDPAWLYGIGRVGQAVYTKRVLLEPTDSALTCLEASFCTDSKIEFPNGVTWTVDNFVSTNRSGSDAIDRTGSGVLNGNAEAVGTILNSAVSGTETEGAAARQMPNSSRVFEYYKNNGTWIDIEDIPDSAPNLVEDVVISPGNNPYGSKDTNPEGIYVIDCKNEDIRFKLVRVEGTIVLLNAGSGSDLDNDHHWEAAARNFPVLMVDGDITFNWHGHHNLRESMAGVNYNPAHTPFEGDSDADQSDEYPPLIKGLVYVSGNLTITQECIHEGAIIASSVTTTDNLTLRYDSVHFDHPPPGFRSGTTMTISPGSWKREQSD